MPIDPRHWAQFRLFDPQEGKVIREPLGEGNGYWVGAPGAFVDPESAQFYLTYRIRRPRGVTPDRGAEVRIAESRDGVTFTDVWTGTKDLLNTTSIERSALMRDDSGMWQLYVSYVDPSDQRWRIDRAEAANPDAFDLTKAEKVMTAADVGVEGVKDPFVFRVAGVWHMIVSIATVEKQLSQEEMHGTSDAYNTGLIRSATALATSVDGRSWHWQGEIMAPTLNGWDKYCARIGCVWYQAPFWLALYDGSADVSENYEERCGLAYSSDLRQFHSLTPSQPLFHDSPGALRYFDVLDMEDHRLIYYEMIRSDGSHDMRVHVQGN